MLGMLLVCFYPRPRTESDQEVSAVPITIQVSIHAPVWGATAGVSKAVLMQVTEAIFENPQFSNVFDYRIRRDNRVKVHAKGIANLLGILCSLRVRSVISLPDY